MIPINEWSVVTTAITLVSFIGIFVGCAWKFASMITKLETLIESLSQTIDRLENEQKEDKQQILEKIEDHDLRLRHVENEISKLGGRT